MLTRLSLAVGDTYSQLQEKVEIPHLLINVGRISRAYSKRGRFGPRLSSLRPLFLQPTVVVVVAAVVVDDSVVVAVNQTCPAQIPLQIP